LLYFIALHRHRDAQGTVRLGISAPYAAFFGVIAAFLRLPRLPDARRVRGLRFRARHSVGISGDHLDRLAAMFLYTMSVVSGQFEM
jgi:lactate permease